MALSKRLIVQCWLRIARCLGEHLRRAGLWNTAEHRRKKSWNLLLSFAWEPWVIFSTVRSCLPGRGAHSPRRLRCIPNVMASVPVSIGPLWPPEDTATAEDMGEFLIVQPIIQRWKFTLVILAVKESFAPAGQLLLLPTTIFSGPGWAVVSVCLDSNLTTKWPLT